VADPVIAYLGLGGNVGDVASSMQQALDRLNNYPECRITAVSRVYRTPPWGPVEQDWFLNACARIETRLSAEALLELVLETERSLGRIRDKRWGPRTLDIDILLYGSVPVALDHLTIPHPRMTERAFVMVPLADIAGEVEIGGRTVGEYADSFSEEGLETTGIRLEIQVS
jgi:2-amino-4-hydroxy-6-hydroxymethyldihydropteridine diphosphokinase